LIELLVQNYYEFAMNCQSTKNWGFLMEVVIHGSLQKAEIPVSVSLMSLLEEKQESTLGHCLLSTRIALIPCTIETAICDKHPMVRMSLG
jgi:hypothetical protein